MKFLRSIIYIVVLFLPALVFAHPGNTYHDGSHHCWTNCSYWGEIYGQLHYHDYYSPTSLMPISPYPTGLMPVSPVTNSPGTPMSDEEYFDFLREIYEDDEDYKKIRNGFSVGDEIYCKDSFEEDGNKCVKPKGVKLSDSNSSLSNPANNERLRITNSLKKGRYAVIEDLSDDELHRYVDEILELVPREDIEEFAPEWFVEEYLGSASEAQTDDREALLKQISDLLALIALLQSQ